MAVKVQIALGVVLILGLVAMGAGLNIVPKDPDTKMLFNRIIDAVFIVLNVPLIADVIAKRKGNDNEKTDSAVPTPDAQ